MSSWHRLSVSLALAGLALAPALADPPARPDLIVDPNTLSETWTVGIQYFDPNSCELQEGCVGGAGFRKLLVFEVKTANIAQHDLVLGDPNGNPLYEFDPCHGHFHLSGFSDYDLTRSGTGVVATGHKQGWCLADVERYLPDAWVSPVGHYGGCGNQGLTAGWADSYDVGFPCQWIDVTGLPNGPHDLRVKVNSARSLIESSYSNNTSTIPVVVDDLAGNPDLTVDAAHLAATWRIESRFFLPGDAALQEGCVGGAGYRRLLTFESRIANIGQFDMVLGEPGSSPYFQYVPAHGHYHLEDYYEYALVDGSGVTRTAGHTVTAFPFDYQPYMTAGWVRPGHFYFGNGLQRGWYDQIGRLVTCHWLDVTDVPDGPYTLTARINPAGDIPETDSTNDMVSIPVTVSQPANGIAHRPDGTFVPGIPLEILPPPGPPQLAPAETRISYDGSTCAPADYNIYFSQRPPASYLYDGAVCNIGTTGLTSITLPDPPPGGLLWFLIVGRTGGIEGGHGFDSQGRMRPLRGINPVNGQRFCSLVESIPRQGCAP